jgi:hypothetical protein
MLIIFITEQKLTCSIQFQSPLGFVDISNDIHYRTKFKSNSDNAALFQTILIKNYIRQTCTYIESTLRRLKDLITSRRILSKIVFEREAVGITLDKPITGFALAVLNLQILLSVLI